MIQPETLKNEGCVRTDSRRSAPDVGIVVAYGKLLPKDVLSIPKHGFVNVHFSLLPKYRGAGPIQWALINGEMETGVTLFWLDEGMDTGPIFLQKTLAIQSDDDADTLRNKLVDLGVIALEEALDLMEAESDSRANLKPGPPAKRQSLKRKMGRWIGPNPRKRLITNDAG